MEEVMEQSMEEEHFQMEAQMAKSHRKANRKSNDDFDDWIFEMDLSSLHHLEAKVDKLCKNVQDRFNPANESDYKMVLRTHLMLEVWAQVKKDLHERIVLGTQYKNGQIMADSFNICVRTKQPFEERFYPNTFLLLLWQQNEQFEQSEEAIERMFEKWKFEFPPNLFVRCRVIDQKKDFTQFQIDFKKRLQNYAERYGMRCTVVPIVCFVSFRRRYQGINWMYKMPLKRYIFGAAVSDNVSNLCSFIGNTKGFEYFARNLNFDQFRALHSALTRDLTLIHGPPGSGKTKCVLLPILKCAYNALQIEAAQWNAILIQQWQRNKQCKDIMPLLNQWKQARIGIFAASNQAIDEIVFAMLHINANPYLEPYQKYCEIPISRVGNTKNMNADIASNRQLSLNAISNYYADLKWTEFGQKVNGDLIKTKVAELKRKLKKMRQQIKKKLNSSSEIELIRILICGYFWQKVEFDCYVALAHASLRYQGVGGVLKVLCKASCVQFMTANYAGSRAVDIKHPSNNFDFALFDECCQIMECEQLIALNFCRRAVFIGDPKQLNATIFYHGKYKKYLVDSLFVRINKFEKSIILRKQYRMHSEICSFPSRYFYDALLINDTDFNKIKSFHFDKSGDFCAYLFFNVTDGKEAINGSSLMNFEECQQIHAKINKLIENDAYLKEICSIGIVTPYSAQRQLLRSYLETEVAYLKREYCISVDIMTVDECQGSERDIILYSCVRSNEFQQIGFLKTKSRLNVAITRAKYALWIYGNCDCLCGDKTWNALIQDAKKRGLIRPRPKKEETKEQKGKVIILNGNDGGEMSELQTVFDFVL